jgi:hypothetical protein
VARRIPPRADRFPKGKHDDQADSTAQFLDWYKKPGPNDGYFEWLRMGAEAIRNPGKDRKHIRVLLKGPPCQQVQTFSNRRLEVSPDGTIELSAEDADPLIGVGWPKLGELHDYELPGYEDGYTEAQSEPPFPQPEHAMGSMEFEAEIAQILAARQAAKEQRKEPWQVDSLLCGASTWSPGRMLRIFSQIRALDIYRSRCGLRHCFDRGNARGTESLQTPRWREPDSNHRSLSRADRMSRVEDGGNRRENPEPDGRKAFAESC